MLDANWNVTAVTNSSGTAQERYAYSAYGIPIFLNATFGLQASSSYVWETLYASYRYDIPTTLGCVRHRYLHHKLGLWMRRDPLGHADSLNVYEYCISNPATLLDSDGRKCKLGIHCWAITGPGGIATGENHCGFTMSITSTTGATTVWIDAFPGTNPLNPIGCPHIIVDTTKPGTGPGKEGPGPVPVYVESPLVTVPDSVCKCITDYAIAIDLDDVPYHLLSTNSNWTLCCMMKKCGLSYSWGIIGGAPPIGCNAQCCQGERDSCCPKYNTPEGALGCDGPVVPCKCP
jgi:RHS repeat-associated protein